MAANPEIADPLPSGSFKESPYDPRYDPLVSATGRGQAYAPTYWVGTAGTPPADDGPVDHDFDADVVVIGSGFTGLVTALNLAQEHGVKAVVLEANRVVWGCTSRNGGQGQKDRKSTRLNSSHVKISYAVFCLKKKKKI